MLRTLVQLMHETQVPLTSTLAPPSTSSPSGASDPLPPPGPLLQWPSDAPPSCSTSRCALGHSWTPQLQISPCPACHAPVLAVKMQQCPICNEPAASTRLRVDHLGAPPVIAPLCLNALPNVQQKIGTLAEVQDIEVHWQHAAIEQANHIEREMPGKL